jgi:hypothetical protein
LALEEVLAAAFDDPEVQAALRGVEAGYAPAFERQVEERLCDPTTHTIVHGDFHPGNMLMHVVSTPNPIVSVYGPAKGAVRVETGAMGVDRKGGGNKSANGRSSSGYSGSSGSSGSGGSGGSSGGGGSGGNVGRSSIYVDGSVNHAKSEMRFIDFQVQYSTHSTHYTHTLHTLCSYTTDTILIHYTHALH